MNKFIRLRLFVGVSGIALFAILLNACGGGNQTLAPPGTYGEFGDSEEVITDFGSSDFQLAQSDGWIIETVDAAANIGWQTSVFAQIYPSPQIQISYYDQVQRDLKLATSSYGAWTTTTLDANTDAGKYNSIVLDTGGGRWISYYKAFQTLRVWTTGEMIPDPTRDFGAFNDIVNVGAETHISYTGMLVINNLNRRSQLRHAVWNGSSWSAEVIEDVDQRMGSFLFTSIAYNPVAGTYHISYRSPSGRLKHAYGTTGDWSTEEILPGNTSTSTIGQTSVVVTPGGEVHIFYSRTGAGGGLFHAWNSGGVWSVEKIASGFGIMTPSSAVLTPDGFIVVAYRSGTRDLVVFRSNPWNPETVDSAGDVGQFASIYYDEAGCTHLAYVKNDTHDLKYARECPPNPPILTEFSATPGTANEGAPITLMASAIDVNGDPITFDWQQVDPMTPAGFFVDPNSANTIYRIPPIGSNDVTFTLKVRACDPGNLCSSEQVIVNGFNIFNGPAYGTSETPGQEKCVTGDSFSPSSVEGSEVLTEIPLLTPDATEFARLKGVANFRSAFASDDEANSEPLFRISTDSVPPLSSSFAGIGFTGLRPPDPHIAVGPNHIIATVNSNWAIFDKSGTKLFEVGAFSWFSPVNSVNFVFDPKVIYDEYNERWILLYHAVGFSSNYSRWLIAASQTSEPTGCWYLYSLDNRLNGSEISSPMNWADYSDISTDGTYTYLSGNQFQFSPTTFDYVKVRALRNSELYSGAVLNWVDYWNLYQTNGDFAFTMRPAYNHGSLPPYQYFANSHWPEDDQVTVWGFKDPFLSTPEIIWMGLPVNTYQFPPDARQPLSNCFIDTIDTRIMTVTWRDGSLWAVQNEGVEWPTRFASALRLYHIDTNNWTVLEDVTYGEGDLDYYDGSVVEDVFGNVGIVFARSSTTLYPGAYYSLKPAGGNFLLPPGTLKAGSTPYNPSGGGCTPTGRGERWGDYAGAWIDPVDNLTFWIFHEYTISPTKWETWIGAFQAP